MKPIPWKRITRSLAAKRMHFLILTLTATLYGLSIRFGYFEKMSSWPRGIAAFNINDLLVIFPFYSIAATFLYFSRVRELKRSIQKKAAVEATLIKRIDDYQRIVKNVNDGIVIEQGGVIRWVNPGACLITGFPRNELIGTPFGELVDGGQWETNQTAPEPEHREAARSPENDFGILHKTGQNRRVRHFSVPMEWEYSPASLNVISDITGEKIAELSIVNNRIRVHEIIEKRTANLTAVNEKLLLEIESHKQTTKILGEREKFLTDIFDAMQDGITVLDCGLNIVRSNSWFKKMYPTVLPHMGKKCYNVYHNREKPCSFCPAAVAINSGKMEGGVMSYRSPGGTDGWLELSAFPLKNERDQVVGVIEHVKDITLRKAAEDARGESEARLMAILDIFEGYIYIADKDYRIEFMNRALVRKHGREALGKTCFTVMHERDTPCPWCRNKQVFEGETCKFDLKSPIDGRWYHIVETPIFDSEGRVKKKQAVLIDITDSKREEESLRESEKALRKENIILKSSINERYKFGEIIGKSPPMQAVYNLMVQAAATNANVIVYGESGTGKELVAKAIHEMSGFHNKRFVPVNCGAIPENLLESEFFGYKKGAFSGAFKDKGGYLDLAENGTLFLDEIGELGLAMQVKLLRAIEGGGFRPVGGSRVRKTEMRIIAATNRNLADHVESGLMREDFYYRIHVIPIHLPPLRERKEDLLLLLDHFLKMHGSGQRSRAMPEKVIEAMRDYNWPGNIRELQNVLQRYLSLDELHFSTGNTSSRLEAEPETEAEAKPLRDAVHNFEKDYIKRVLACNKGHRTRAAETLGIDRRTLQRKMKTYRIDDMRQ